MSTRAIDLLGRAAACVAAMLLPSMVRAEAPLPEAPKKSDVISAGGKLMPGDQVKKMFLGNTIYYIWLVDYRPMLLKRGAVTAVYHSDERHRWISPSGKKIEMLWWMEGDIAWGELLNGTGRTGGLIYELDGKTFSCNPIEDICRTMIRMVPGNPEGM